MQRAGIVVYHGVDNGSELGEFGRLADEGGFESLWVTERYFHEETFSMLGYLAATTRRVRLGVGVVNPYTRNPALLAMAAATVDRISGGRFILGLGRSDKAVIEGKMGIPYGRPRTTLEETVTVVRALLSGDTGTSISGGVKLRDARLAVGPAQSSVPVYLGAMGPRALHVAGAIADGVLLDAYKPAAYAKWAVGEVRDAARQAGRDPDSVDIACMLVTRLRDDPGPIWTGLKERIVRLLAEDHVGETLLERGRLRPRNPTRTQEVRSAGRRCQGLAACNR